MRILIVDDRALGIRGLRNLIEAADPTYSVDGATAADDAIRLAQASNPPFDVFLIDQNLGLGRDGIELMVELQQISPRSDTMIFTGDEHTGTKQRAIEAGACDYFIKPLDEQRLLAQLHRLQRDRGTRVERNWLAALAEVSTELQGGATVKEVGQIIVQAAPRLGFERARLWLFKAETQEMWGLCEKGNVGLEVFESLCIPLSKMPYSQDALQAGKPKFYKGTEFGPSELETQFGRKGFKVAIGERAKVPLIVNRERIGVLTLDNAEHAQTYTAEHCELLQLLGNQAASALERARIQEEADSQITSQTFLNQVTATVMKEAAKGDLHKLLQALHTQICEHLRFELKEFTVALLDRGEPESAYLDCCYDYRDGCDRRRHWCSYADDPATSWMASIFKDRQVQHDSRSLRSGFPLLLDNEAIGVVLTKDEQSRLAQGEAAQNISRITAHIAGLIQAVYKVENDRRRNERAELSKKLVEKLRDWAHTDENHFWHAFLTFVTHREGYSFNRAVLLRYGPEGLTIAGRMGIGHFDRIEWQQEVEADEAQGDKKSFAAYLDLSSIAHLRITPLATATLQWNWRLADDKGGPFLAVYQKKIYALIDSDELKHWLPDNARNLISEQMQPRSCCALVPWLDGDDVVGVLFLDNAMDEKPVRHEDVLELQELLKEANTILNGVGEAARLRRKGESYENILRLSQHLMAAQAEEKSLKELLGRLCREARGTTKADFVVLYPLSADGTGYDTKTVVVEGDLPDSSKERLYKEKPRQQGVAAYVLRNDRLAINNVDEHDHQSDLTFDGMPLSKQPFIVREKVKAFIGVTIRVAGSTRRLGVMYLDYRRTQAFSESDIVQAEHLASVAGVLIGNKYKIEQESEKFTKESSLLQAIHEESLAADTTEEKVISVALQKAQEMFGHPEDIILTRRKWETNDSDETVEETFRYYQWNPLANYEEILPADTHRLLIARAWEAFSMRERYVEGNTLVVPIKTNYRMIGCISIVGHEGREQIAQVSRFATAAAMALDNVRRQVRLKATLKAVKQVVEPTDLERTLEGVIRAARDASSGLACVTLWHRDPISREVVLGAEWGVHKNLPGHGDSNTGGEQGPERIIEYVMSYMRPLWVEDVYATDADPKIHASPFVKRQELASVAAFPLLVDSECIGALFFNYRTKHRFSPGEKDALTIFAATAAAGIHDAQLLEQAQQGEKSLMAALEVVNAVGTELDLEKVLQTVLRSLKDHFDRQKRTKVQPYVMLYDQDDDVLYLPAVAREFMPVDNPAYKDELRLRLDGSDKGIVCRVAHEAMDKQGSVRVMNFPDIRTEPDYLNFYSRSVSLLCAGLVTQEDQTRERRLWGILAVSSPQAATFNVHDARLLELASQQALIALDRAENAARLRFKDAVSSVTTWAAELAHDINKEIGAIRTRVYWLQNEEQALSEQGLQWVNEIDRGAARLVDVTRDVRTDQQMDIEEFDLCQMLARETANLLRQRWPKINLATDFRPDRLWLKTYRVRLWRGVRHLVRNAADAMEGEGVLTICTRIRGNAYDIVEVQIEDTGPGVPADLRSVVLAQPYSSKGELQDRGYGLLIARQLIESLGGTIRILPQEPGRGAVFAISLPLTPERLQ